MKRIFSRILVCCLCLLLTGQAALAAGEESDPVLSLSYLNGTMKAELLAEAEELIRDNQNEQLAKAFETFAEVAAEQNYELARSAVGTQYAKSRLLLKSGDVLNLAPGAQATLLAGTAVSVGANLIDITKGSTFPANTGLVVNHCYMKNASPEGGVRITSGTAEVFLDGVYSLQYSSATDYASLANALYEMKLFAGKTGSVTGYALEQSCTRIEALVMFLRLIGVADEAAQYTGVQPFADVPQNHWASRYLAYAYANGLAYGTSTTSMLFSPNNQVSAIEYMTFLLRALHYREGDEFTYRNALDDAASLGLFSSSEIQTISNLPFLRAQMVYLSYYTLFGTEQNSGKSLILQMVGQNTVSFSSAVEGACKVVGGRIS